MTTRKELIIGKYVELETELKKHFDDTLFPSLEDIDLADLVYYITMIFLGVITDLQFHAKIQELLDTNGVKVSNEVFQKIAPLIIDFVNWLRVL